MPNICFTGDQPELIYSNNTIVSHTNSQNLTADFALMRGKGWAKKHHISEFWQFGEASLILEMHIIVYCVTLQIQCERILCFLLPSCLISFHIEFFYVLPSHHFSISYSIPSLKSSTFLPFCISMVFYALLTKS